MKACIVEGCRKKVEGGRPGSDESFYCKEHKIESRQKLAKESRNLIKKIATNLFTSR